MSKSRMYQIRENDKKTGWKNILFPTCLIDSACQFSLTRIAISLSLSDKTTKGDACSAGDEENIQYFEAMGKLWTG